MIFLLVILIIISAFFSASETSFFNIKKHQSISDRVKILLDKPRELLTFILIGNTIVNIAIGSIAAHYTLNVIASNLTMVNQESKIIYHKALSDYQHIWLIIHKLHFLPF